MSSTTAPSTDRARLWRCVLLGGAVGVAVALPVYGQGGQGGPLLFVAGLVAGYLAPEAVDAYAAGGRAGLIAALPLVVWFLYDSTTWFLWQDGWFRTVGSLLAIAFVLGAGYFAGGIGAGIGGWLAVQFGRNEPS
ncbi:DUF5518 domain-containing protein [Halolamina sediminis]|uniref:DUF5518 domain-containing protein n=1 Tax=Halolamina sediminis TaxID=1480675 RepID=UPI0006B632AC|nr:DUF5518 domain-containing protein [Halolamina sediminis]